MTNISPADNRGAPKNFALGICFAGLFIFYLIKFFQDSIVQALFEQGSFALLNGLTGAAEPLPLGYYLGRMDKVFFGPLTMLISGLSFLYFCRIYLAESRARVFTAAVFVYLVLTRWEVLFFPPYGDTIAGPFAEAIWLFHHRFDYLGLSQEPGYIYGGPKVYLFSIYPAYLAFLMTVISNSKIFLLLNHLLVFMMGSGIVSFMRAVFKQITGPALAVTAALAVLFIPVFQGQVEMINMEIPMTFFAVAAMYFLTRRKLGIACLFSIVSAMVKGVAIYMPAVVAFVSLWLYFFDEKERFRWKNLLTAFFAGGFVVLKLYAAFFILNEKGSADMVGLFEGWFEMKYFPETYCFLFSFLILCGVWIQRKLSKKKTSTETFHKDYPAWIFLIGAAGWFAVFINSYAGFPRYRLLVIPFIVFITFHAIQSLIRSERVLDKLTTGFIVLALLCSYGLFHPRINNEKDQVQDHVILERSLEYRDDIKFRIQLARDIQERYADYKIGAPFLLAHSLGLPELGYVTKKLDVMIYGFPCKLEGISVFNGLDHLDLMKTVWVAVVSEIPEHMKRFGSYPVDPKDIIIEERIYGKRKATIFKGGIAMERMRLISKEVLKQLHKKGLLTDPNLHNFGLDEVERHR